MRWPNGAECPHCGSVNRAYFINAKSMRITKAGNASFRRLWKCAECKKQFSLLVGTIFHRSHVPLSKWLMALYMMSASKNGVAAYEVHRTLGVTNKTAWFTMHRIREAMKRGELAESMQGIIIADETYIGGAPKNRHRQGKAKVGKHVVGTEGKQTAVLTLVNKLTGEARSRAMADVTGATLERPLRNRSTSPIRSSTPMVLSTTGSLVDSSRSTSLLTTLHTSTSEVLSLRTTPKGSSRN